MSREADRLARHRELTARAANGASPLIKRTFGDNQMFTSKPNELQAKLDALDRP